MNDKILKLDFNERSDKPSPLPSDLFEPFTHRITKNLWQYPNREVLEASISEEFKIKPEQVFCSNGGDESIYILMRILSEGKRLILPLPAFSQYTWGIKSWKLFETITPPICIPANDDLTIQCDRILQEIQQNPNAVVVITRPNNPTGELIKTEQLRKIIQKANAFESWVFLDEAYIEFSDVPSTPKKLLSEFDNLVILRTFSKAFGLAGVRVGYLLGSAAIIQEFKNRSMPFNVPEPSLQFANLALSEQSKTDMVSYREQIIKNRITLCEWFRVTGIQFNESQGNFILIKLNPLKAQCVASFLKRNEIVVRVFSEPDLEGCLRITIPFYLDKLFPLLKQALSPDLVCLDMDGVLIDTSGSYDSAILSTVQKFSGKKLGTDSISKLKAKGGFNNDWLVAQQLLKSQGANIPLDTVIDTFQKFYLGNDQEKIEGFINNETPLINPSFVSLINLRKDQNFAIVTGRPKAEAKLGVESLNLKNIDIVSLDDVENGKPDPEGIKLLQDKYSFSTWMCGDNPDDIKAALASNSVAIGIGSDNKQALYSAGADIVLDSINELESWLCLNL